MYSQPLNRASGAISSVEKLNRASKSLHLIDAWFRGWRDLTVKLICFSKFSSKSIKDFFSKNFSRKYALHSTSWLWKPIEFYFMIKLNLSFQIFKTKIKAYLVWRFSALESFDTGRWPVFFVVHLVQILISSTKLNPTIGIKLRIIFNSDKTVFDTVETCNWVLVAPIHISSSRNDHIVRVGFSGSQTLWTISFFVKGSDQAIHLLWIGALVHFARAIMTKSPWTWLINWIPTPAPLSQVRFKWRI